MNAHVKPKQTLLDDLASIVGADHVLSDAASCELYSQDVFHQAKQASCAIVRPDNSDELSRAVKAATTAGFNVIPRGGGMSYTSGYVPTSENTITLDLTRMDRVLEINTQDMYVTVECGITWKQLHQALKETGYRTPYWGTLSGTYATVGGGLSQNSIFWGSGQYGTAADSVISLDVVLADGSVVSTGSAAQRNSQPFFRHFGPDLTGLFTCDAGSLGFKATATFRLIKQFEGRAFSAFDFKTAEDAIGAMSEISRQGLAMECFGFDPYLQAQRLKRESLSKDVKALAGVMKNAGSLMGALKDGAKVALAGRGYMDDVDHSVQLMIEDYTQHGADAKAKAVKAIAEGFNGREISNSIPKIARANPFGPVNNMLGPDGERWVPIHALVSHSNAAADYQAIIDLFERHKEGLSKYKIETGFLYAIIASNAFVLEPVFFWPDASTSFHKKYVEDEYFANMPKHAEDLDARNYVTTIRNEFAELFKQRGGVHMQLGKFYKYKDGIGDQSLDLITMIKQCVDPHNQVNPGALGLGD